MRDRFANVLNMVARSIRQQPRGLVSLRFLAPGLTAEQRAHRALLRKAYGDRHFVVTAAVLGASWMHWSIVGAHRATERALHRHAAAAEARFGMSRRDQQRLLLRLALAHGVPPLDVYEFELFEPRRRSTMWSYAFSNEVGAFHRQRSERSCSTPTKLDPQHRLLSDKRATCEALDALGVAASVPLGRLAQGSDPAELLDFPGPVFCRPNVGNAAHGACRISTKGGGVEVEPVVGVPPADGMVYLTRLLAAGDLLVEQVVDPHRAFVERGAPDELAVVVRIITEHRAPVAAWLELPVQTTNEAGRAVNVFAALPVDIGSGRVESTSTAPWRLSPTVRAELQIASDAAAGMQVPDWERTLDAIDRAGTLCPDVFGVAWDVALGPNGPVVLEGNTGWSLAIPQRLLGPFIERELGRALRSAS